MLFRVIDHTLREAVFRSPTPLPCPNGLRVCFAFIFLCYGCAHVALKVFGAFYRGF